MKQLFFSLALSCVITASFAQKMKVQSAFNYLKYQELDKAKEAIDAASQDPTTATMSKTWFYRAQVYLSIDTTPDKNFHALHPTPIDESYNSFMKAYEFDMGKIDLEDFNFRLAVCHSLMYTKAATAYKSAKYTDAINYFDKCAAIFEKWGKMDTVSVYYGGISYELDNKIDEAIIRYKKCVDVDFLQGESYVALARAYKKKGDKAALTEVINKGRAKHPNSQEIINYEFNMYLENNDYEGALKSIDASLVNDPNNAIYHYNKGYLYDQKKDITNAETSYLKAIELKPDYFDASYNLGALFFNTGAELINQSNDLPLKEADKSEKL